MNPLTLELLAHDRAAELRRQARSSSFRAGAVTVRTPDPRVPRRGPLASIMRLRLLARAALP